MTRVECALCDHAATKTVEAIIDLAPNRHVSSDRLFVCAFHLDDGTAKVRQILADHVEPDLLARIPVERRVPRIVVEDVEARA